MYSNSLDRDFARISLRGQAPPPPSTSAPGQPSGTGLASTTATAGSSARSRAQLVADSALADLKALGSHLTPAGRGAIRKIEVMNTGRSIAPDNGDFFDFLDPSRQSASVQHTLKRRPSFFLARSFVVAIGTGMPDSEEKMFAPPQPEEKKILSAQVAALLLQMKIDQDVALGEARAGARLCPMTLERVRFGAFLNAQKPSILRIIDACALNGPQRHAALRGALTSLATAYLREQDMLPSGLQPGFTFESRGRQFDHSPVSTVLLQEAGLSESSTAGREPQTKRIMWLKTGGIDEFNNDFMELDLQTLGFTKQFESCSVPQQQAAAYLQHLFHALATADEVTQIKRKHARGEFSEAMLHTADEKAYQGSRELGDECGSPDGLSQRDELGAVLTDLRLRTELHSVTHHALLLPEKQLQDWVTGPELAADFYSLCHPNKRLLIAQMDAVGEALWNTGVFSRR